MWNTKLSYVIAKIAANFANDKQSSDGLFTRAKQGLLAKLAAAYPITDFAIIAKSKPFAANVAAANLNPAAAIKTQGVL